MDNSILAATNNVGDLKDRIAELESENTALKEQIERLRLEREIDENELATLRKNFKSNTSMEREKMKKEIELLRELLTPGFDDYIDCDVCACAYHPDESECPECKRHATEEALEAVREWLAIQDGKNANSFDGIDADLEEADELRTILDGKGGEAQ